MDLFSKTLPIAQLADKWRAEDDEAKARNDDINSRLKRGETVTSFITVNAPFSPHQRANELTTEIVKLQQTLEFIEQVIEAAYAVTDKAKTEHLQQLEIALLRMQLNEKI